MRKSELEEERERLGDKSPKGYDHPKWRRAQRSRIVVEIIGPFTPEVQALQVLDEAKAVTQCSHPVRAQQISAKKKTQRRDITNQPPIKWLPVLFLYMD